jgi:hypothetical protein
MHIMMQTARYCGVVQNVKTYCKILRILRDTVRYYRT